MTCMGGAVNRKRKLKSARRYIPEVNTGTLNDESCENLGYYI
jgi:hypothetical protein